jgi:hypothetical protein
MLFKALRTMLVGILVFAWVFSGWQQILHFPQKPDDAHAAALALHSSTPASVKGLADPLTTASFTPPANSMLVISAMVNAGTSENWQNINITDNLGTHLKYNLAQSKGYQNLDNYGKPVLGQGLDVTAYDRINVARSGRLRRVCDAHRARIHRC